MKRADRIRISQFREGLAEFFSELAESSHDFSSRDSEVFFSSDGNAMGSGNDSGSPVISLPEQLSE